MWKMIVRKQGKCGEYLLPAHQTGEAVHLLEGLLKLSRKQGYFIYHPAPGRYFLRDRAYDAQSFEAELVYDPATVQVTPPGRPMQEVA